MEVFLMREKFKNELLLLLHTYVNPDTLKEIDERLNIMLSDYEIESRKTEVVIYEYQIPKTVEIYIVSKKYLDCQIKLYISIKLC